MLRGTGIAIYEVYLIACNVCYWDVSKKPTNSINFWPTASMQYEWHDTAAYITLIQGKNVKFKKCIWWKKNYSNFSESRTSAGHGNSHREIYLLMNIRHSLYRACPEMLNKICYKISFNTILFSLSILCFIHNMTYDKTKYYSKVRFPGKKTIKFLFVNTSYVNYHNLITTDKRA